MEPILVGYNNDSMPGGEATLDVQWVMGVGQGITFMIIIISLIMIIILQIIIIIINNMMMMMKIIRGSNYDVVISRGRLYLKLGDCSG